MSDYCRACETAFGGEDMFDRHRVGKHGVDEGPNRRRCATPEEMRNMGMKFIEKPIKIGSSITANGHWIRDRVIKF